jgi:hypothetical protein
MAPSEFTPLPAVCYNVRNFNSLIGAKEIGKAIVLALSGGKVIAQSVYLPEKVAPFPGALGILGGVDGDLRRL